MSSTRRAKALSEQLSRPGRVLGLFGSPRRGGNTDILLGEFLRGCEHGGAGAERLYLSKLKVSGCLGCGACTETGRCVVQDEMQDVYDALDRCSRIVLACPVYFYNVPAQAKAVIDRTQALWSRRHRAKNAPEASVAAEARKGFLISVGATRGKRLFEGVRLTARYFFDAMNAEYAGELFFEGVDEKGDIRKHPGAMEDCCQAGRTFASN